jgi:hypothetical protein
MRCPGLRHFLAGTTTADAPNAAPAYDPPRIERILAPEELEREILYAGDTPSNR